MYNAIIIGAGPAGLTAGYLLTKAGMGGVLVLEESPTHVGGISRTESHDGFLFDIGGHRFFSKSEEVEALWRELLPDDFIECPRKSRILYRGKLYDYPLNAGQALMNLGLVESTACVLSYLRARLFPNREPRSFHDWVANQFGERLFGIFFRTYTEKVWGMSCDEISADWAAQRIKGLSLGVAIAGAVRKSLRLGATSGAAAKTLVETFRYPRRGPGMLWDAAADSIRSRGGTILLGQSVRGLSWDAAGGLWEVSAVDAAGRTTSWKARHVISSAALRDLVPAIVPPLAAANDAKTLKYRDFLTVALFLRTPPAFDDNWIYVHEPGVKVGRIQNFGSWSAEMVPAAGQGCLGLEYFCFEGDGLWSSPDEALIALATSELETLGLAKPGQIAGGRVVRQPRAYPVYDEGYKTAVDRVRAELAERFPTFHPVGRNGLHKYNNQDHAMMTAMLTVRNILGSDRLYDVWQVNEDAFYQEEISLAEASSGASGVRLVPQALRK